MVDYNKFAKTFSQSRKNMKWEEIEYFLTSSLTPLLKGEGDDLVEILDIGCGNGRLLGEIKTSSLNSFSLEGEGSCKIKYLGIDLSKGLLEEAKKTHPDHDFQELNMVDIDTLNGKYDCIFFIASFHHLQSLRERIEVLKKAKNLLSEGGKIFMTNWALNSEINSKNYYSCQIEKSQNEFGSTDYNVKFGEFDRYYHCFHLSELDHLGKESGFQIIENRLFENDKNFITILKK